MGLFKVKVLSLLLSVVLIFMLFFTCCGVLLVFALLLSVLFFFYTDACWCFSFFALLVSLLFFFGCGMDEVMMYWLLWFLKNGWGREMVGCYDFWGMNGMRIWYVVMILWKHEWGGDVVGGDDFVVVGWLFWFLVLWLCCHGFIVLFLELLF